MSVRGTVFGIEILKAKDGTVFEVIRVFDGKVLAVIEGTNAEATIEPGECAVVKEGTEGNGGNDAFVVGSALTKEFFNNPSGDVETVKEGEDPVTEIVYEVLSAEYVEQLIEMVQDGEELVLNEEELEEIKETIIEEAEKEAEEVKEESSQSSGSQSSSNSGSSSGSDTGSDTGSDDTGMEEGTYTVTDVTPDDSKTYGSLTSNGNSMNVEVPVIVSYDLTTTDGTKKTLKESAVIKVNMSADSGSIGASTLVSSDSEVVNTYADDLNNYLGAGYFTRTDKFTSFIDGHYSYTPDGTSIKVEGCNYVSDNILSSVDLSMNLNRVLIDDRVATGVLALYMHKLKEHHHKTKVMALTHLHIHLSKKNIAAFLLIDTLML